jgi:hypothetical protein
MRLLRPDTRIEKISVKYLFLNKKIILIQTVFPSEYQTIMLLYE